MKATTLLRAAAILEREADCLCRSYVVSTMNSDEPVWDDADAKADHDEMVAIAAELRDQATASPSPLPNAATGGDSART